MAKQVNLTVEGVKKRRKMGRTKLYSDAGGRGLYLKTTKTSTASWIFRWRDRSTGKLRDMGLGTVDEIGLAQARDTASDLQQVVRGGGDPIAERQRKRQERITAHAKAQTFQQCAEAYYAAKIEPTGLTEKHKRRWKSMMRDHVYPTIGGVMVLDIDTSHVQSVLQPIWTTKLDTAKRVRQNTEKVLGYATASKLRVGENPARWQDNLQDLMADPKDIRKANPVQHHKALSWKQINPFINDLRERDGMAARVLQFTILTAARPAEARLVPWDEIDLENALWVIPAERMLKTGSQHTIPLSKTAVKFLQALPRSKDSPFVFPAPRGGALTDAAVSKVLKRMNVDATVHGFRSTFKDWARSTTAYADEISELALSHVNNDATRAAYARDELIPQRTRMMRDWARFIERKPVQDATITPINQQAIA